MGQTIREPQSINYSKYSHLELTKGTLAGNNNKAYDIGKKFIYETKGIHQNGLGTSPKLPTVPKPAKIFGRSLDCAEWMKKVPKRYTSSIPLLLPHFQGRQLSRHHGGEVGKSYSDHVWSSRMPASQTGEQICC